MNGAPLSRPASHCGDVGAAPGDRDVDAALRRRAADEAACRSDALAEDAAHLVAGLGVDVAAQRVAAACLVDAEVFDRNPARAWPRSRPVNAIEHAHLPSQLVLSGTSAPRCRRSLSGLGGRLADGARVCSAGRETHNHGAVLAVIKPTLPRPVS